MKFLRSNWKLNVPVSCLLFATTATLEGKAETVTSTTSTTTTMGISGATPATNLIDATEHAKQGAGRANPFVDELQPKPFPKGSSIPASAKQKFPAPAGTVPPPPPTTNAHNLLVPPPPPGVPYLPSGGGSSSMSLSELPEPPEKPQIAPKLKLVGVIGERAVFVFSDSQLRRNHKWPKTLSLAPGDQFETVNVVSIDDGTVTLEEDGEKTIKELERIR